MSLLTQTSDDITVNPEFRADFERLTLRELSPGNQGILDEGAIGRLLESSAIFSLSEKDSHQKLAYKIIVYLLSQYSVEYESVPFVGQLVLTRLGDLPVIKQMISQNEVPDYFSYFNGLKENRTTASDGNAWASVLSFPEVVGRKALNQITIAGTPLDLTDFQRRILNIMREGTNLAFSAPTSSGKSFVLFNFIAERLATNPQFCAIYIVPTKALVSEVHGRISEIARRIPNLAGFVVFTGASTLSSSDVKTASKKVFVLTQERLQEMVAAGTLDFPVDLLIVDEAQQVANEGRGIVIEDAVGELVRKQERMQKVFVSPYVTNPERFASIFGMRTKDLRVATTSKSPVGQNYILVTFRKLKGDTYVTDATALVRELERDGKASTFTLAYDLEVQGLSSSAYLLKAWVARNMTNPGESTLIYCNRPADCRKVADELVSGSERSKKLSDRLKETISFLRSNVHKEYYLADYLPYGIGYHYGTMPQFVRTQVKRLFEEQELSFLACTSTLLEGVNLPAKNVVLLDPKKGSVPMDSLSVRNLMGRAGRLNVDYYGKIYCINLDEWKSGTEALTDSPEPIESSTETALSKNIDELIGYLVDTKAPATERTEAMARSLIMKQLMDPSQGFLADFKSRHPSIDAKRLDEVGFILKEIVSKMTLDRGLALKNRLIDPRFQEELYQWMRKLDEPPLPPFPGWGLWDKLNPIFEVISRTLLRDETKTYRHYGIIASQWIDHYSYRRILEKSIDYELQNESNKKKPLKKVINDAIEDLDDVLENKVRYYYAQGLKCYCEILAKVQAEKGKEWKYCEQLPQFLEAGASDESVLYLIGAGLSRTTAIEIFGSFGGKGGLPKWESISETIDWLKQNRKRLQMNIHQYFFDELEPLFGITGEDASRRF